MSNIISTAALSKTCTIIDTRPTFSLLAYLCSNIPAHNFDDNRPKFDLCACLCDKFLTLELSACLCHNLSTIKLCDNLLAFNLCVNLSAFNLCDNLPKFGICACLCGNLSITIHVSNRTGNIFLI